MCFIRKQLIIMFAENVFSVTNCPQLTAKIAIRANMFAAKWGIYDYE